jgi:hypothetical protein
MIHRDEIVQLAERAEASGQHDLAVILFTLAGSLANGSTPMLAELVAAFSRAELGQIVSARQRAASLN